MCIFWNYTCYTHICPNLPNEMLKIFTFPGRGLASQRRKAQTSIELLFMMYMLNISLSAMSIIYAVTLLQEQTETMHRTALWRSLKALLHRHLAFRLPHLAPASNWQHCSYFTLAAFIVSFSNPFSLSEIQEDELQGSLNSPDTSLPEASRVHVHVSVSEHCL